MRIVTWNLWWRHGPWQQRRAAIAATLAALAPDASAERVAQVRELAGFVAAHRDGAAYPPVVTGDFNAEPDSDEPRLMCGHLTAPAAPGVVLLDAWRYAEPNDPGHTWDRRNGHLGHTAVLDARIDYVLVGIPLDRQLGWVRSVRVTADRPVAGAWPSDHFAVAAELTGE